VCSSPTYARWALSAPASVGDTALLVMMRLQPIRFVVRRQQLALYARCLVRPIGHPLAKAHLYMAGETHHPWVAKVIEGLDDWGAMEWLPREARALAGQPIDAQLQGLRRIRARLKATSWRAWLSEATLHRAPPPSLRAEAAGELGAWAQVRCLPLHLMAERWGSLWAWLEHRARPQTPWLRVAMPGATRVLLTRFALGTSPALAANDHSRPRLERVCSFCRDKLGVLAVEDEYHVAGECPAFDGPRQVWWAVLLREGAFRFFGFFWQPSSARHRRRP